MNVKVKVSRGGIASGVARSALALVIVAAFGIKAGAQNLNQTGTGTDAIKGIVQPGSFPIKITKSGSYRLNGNLTVKNNALDAIDVSASNVTIVSADSPSLAA
jgi:hypothetical protein